MAKFDSNGNLIREKHTGPTRVGYYVFDLPNGEVIDIFGAPVELPADLRRLIPRYVERTVEPRTTQRTVAATTDELEAMLHTKADGKLGVI